MLKNATAILGIVTVTVFLLAYFVVGLLNPQFHLVHDFISKLGAPGQPLATYWNLIGFGVVGFLFAAFGFSLGLVLQDRWVGMCLLVSGIGFALASVPTEFSDPDSSLAKIHFVSICIAMAGWCVALARMGYIESKHGLMKPAANIAAALSIAPMVAMAGSISSEPIAHRLVFFVVFGWILFVSTCLLLRRSTAIDHK